MDEAQLIQEFLGAPAFAVVGASNDPQKFGYRLVAHYQKHGRKVYPIHPKEEQIQGLKAYATLVGLPEKVESVSIVTPPSVTEKVVMDAQKAGARTVWMQPGAESQAAIDWALAHGLRVIAHGPCVLVALR